MDAANLPDDLNQVEHELLGRQRPGPAPDFRHRLLAAVTHELDAHSSVQLPSPRATSARLLLIGCTTAAAALIAVFAVLYRAAQAPTPSIPYGPPTAQAPDFGDSLATWQLCRRALDQSPRALDELFEKQSARRIVHANPAPTMHASHKFLVSTGELQ